MSIVLAGGTGVIGQALLDHAGNAHDIITVGRRPTERAAHEIVADFTNLPALPPAETAICVLGTTIGKAGSREAFYAVDYGAVMSFAQAARAAGTRHFIVVTAVGADPSSAVFYSRVKGEVERDLQARIRQARYHSTRLVARAAIGNTSRRKSAEGHRTPDGSRDAGPVAALP